MYINYVLPIKILYVIAFLYIAYIIFSNIIEIIKKLYNHNLNNVIIEYCGNLYVAKRNDNSYELLYVYRSKLIGFEDLSGLITYKEIKTIDKKISIISPENISEILLSVLTLTLLTGLVSIFI